MASSQRIELLLDKNAKLFAQCDVQRKQINQLEKRQATTLPQSAMRRRLPPVRALASQGEPMMSVHHLPASAGWRILLPVTRPLRRRCFASTGCGRS